MTDVDAHSHAQIVVLDKLDYCASMKNLESTRHLLNVEFIKGDIRSVDLLNLIFRKNTIDVVLHFAAQSHVDNSFGNSFEFTKNNINRRHARAIRSDETRGDRHAVRARVDG